MESQGHLVLHEQEADVICGFVAIGCSEGIGPWGDVLDGLMRSIAEAFPILVEEWVALPWDEWM